MKKIVGFLMYISLVLLGSGCGKEISPSAKVLSILSANSDAAAVIAVDLTDEGKVTSVQLPQPITMLSEKDDRRMVLLGSELVRERGIMPVNGRLPLIGGRLDKNTIAAVVEGKAAAFLHHIPIVSYHGALQRLALRLEGFDSYQGASYREALVPYISMGSASDALPTVHVKAAVLRGGEMPFLLDDEELQLAACLNGQAHIEDIELPELEQGQVIQRKRTLSCQTKWRSNGDLKAPRLNADITVTSDKKEGVSRPFQKEQELALEQKLGTLIGRLQMEQADPLDIGQTVRSQYHGVWTQERWRAAFSRAVIVVKATLIP